jgi:hypothetical protein
MNFKKAFQGCFPEFQLKDISQVCTHSKCKPGTATQTDEYDNFPKLKELKISWRRGRKMGMSIYGMN